MSRWLTGSSFKITIGAATLPYILLPLPALQLRTMGALIKTLMSEKIHDRHGIKYIENLNSLHLLSAQLFLS